MIVQEIGSKTRTAWKPITNIHRHHVHKPKSLGDINLTTPQLGIMTRNAVLRTAAKIYAGDGGSDDCPPFSTFANFCD